MRRIKFKLGKKYISEQKSILETNQRIFDEHKVFTDEDILIDNSS